MRIEHNFSLLPYNTFGLNVCCRQFCEYDTASELENLIKSGILESTLWLHTGGGSNLLFLSDYDGLILHSGIKGIEILEDTEKDCTVRVGAGEIWDDFVVWCVDRELGGVENLSSIPGEAGASAVQNIGAYGVEAKDVIERVETISAKDASRHIFKNEECRFAYRNSIFKSDNSLIVTHVVFRLKKLPFYSYNLEYGRIREALPPSQEINLSKIRETVIAIRDEKLPDPKVLGNAGSFFKNPVVSNEKFSQLQEKYPSMPHYPVEEVEKIPAAWLIEQSGWKGKSYRQAGVYDKQALVLVNRGGATGEEIWELANLIQNSVMEKFGVKIEPEVKMVF